eukprot:gene3357-biopygen2115
MAQMNIVCVGAGYVGGPTMAVIAHKCPHITVHIFDISEARIKAWNAPTDGSAFLPIYEPGLEEIVLQVRNKNLFFTTDSSVLKKADVVFIAVNTPTKMEGVGAGCAADLTYIESCARLVGETVEKEHVVVVEKSTVPVRCSMVVRRILETYRRPHVNFSILSNPEFLAEGTAISDLLNPDRVLIGGSDDAIGVLSSVYENWVPKDRIVTTNLWSSELSKLVANAFLAQRISSINSISPVRRPGPPCRRSARRSRGTTVSANTSSTRPLGSKSCFQKDVLNLIYICQSEGLHETAEYWREVVKMNDYQKERFYRKVVDMCSGTLRSKIAVLGFAFKKDTSDTRESAAIYICAKMLVEGAKIYIYDPKVPEEAIYSEVEYFMDVYGISVASVKKRSSQGAQNALLDFIRANIVVVRTAMDAVDNASAVLVLTEWDEFKTVNYEEVHQRMLKPACLLDGRLILDHERLAEIGFEVFAVGKCTGV